MALPIVVPDASVIQKWVLPATDEADLKPALALRDAIAAGDVQAVVPTLSRHQQLTERHGDSPDRAAGDIFS